jgi:hypothetical protein
MLVEEYEGPSLILDIEPSMEDEKSPSQCTRVKADGSSMEARRGGMQRSMMEDSAIPLPVIILNWQESVECNVDDDEIEAYFLSE